MNFQEHDLITYLKQKLSQPLLGYEAQKIMEPPMRKTFQLDSSSARKASTLLALYFDTEWKFILIKRSGHPLDKHKGQISFPGGSIELNELPEEAAVREAEEEINLNKNKVDLLGKLSDLFIPVSNFIVYPFVGFIENFDRNELVKEEAEVEEIIHISLNDFLDENNVAFQSMKMPNGYLLENVPIFNIKNNVIWGATSMMLSEFKELLKESK